MITDLESVPSQIGTAILDLRDGNILTVKIQYSILRYILFINCYLLLHHTKQVTGDFNDNKIGLIYRILKVLLLYKAVFLFIK